MDEDELRRMVRQQREMQRRITDALRGPAGEFLHDSSQIERTMRALAGPIEDLRRQNEQARRALEAMRPALAQAAEARQLLSHLDGPIQEYLASQNIRDTLVEATLANQEAIARSVDVLKRQWGGLGLDTPAWNLALRQAAEGAAVAVRAEDEVAAAPDDTSAAAQFLSSAAGLSLKARAALVAALIETANQLLDAAQTLATDAAVGATRLAFAFVFLALMLYAIDDDR